MIVEEHLDRLGVVIPAPPKPVGAYVPAVIVGNLVFAPRADRGLLTGYRGGRENWGRR